MRFIFVLFLLIGCVKSKCIIAVDVVLKNDLEITASAFKKIKCGDYISFPFVSNEATKIDVRFIEINFFQGSRVVFADVVFGFDFIDSVYKHEYTFDDTNPDLMIWKVFNTDRSGHVQYETLIK